MAGEFLGGKECFSVQTGKLAGSFAQVTKSLTLNPGYNWGEVLLNAAVSSCVTSLAVTLALDTATTPITVRRTDLIQDVFIGLFLLFGCFLALFLKILYCRP